MEVQVQYHRAFSTFDVLEISPKWLGAHRVMLFHFIVHGGLRQMLNGAWTDALKPSEDDHAMGEQKSEATGVRYCILRIVLA